MKKLHLHPNCTWYNYIDGKFQPMRGRCIKQHGSRDCGAACLVSVAAHYRLQLPLQYVRKLSGTNSNGSSLSGMMAAAGQMGLASKAVRAGIESIHSLPRPAILHLKAAGGGHHFVVLYKLNQKRVVVMDPADGKMHGMALTSLDTCWTGVAMILSPGLNFNKGACKKPVWTRFWMLLRPHRYTLYQAFAGALLYTLLGFSSAIYIQKLTDYVLVGGNTRLLNLLSVVMLILLAFQSVIAWLKDIYLVRTGQLIDVRLILGYYEHLLQLPQQFFDTMQVGEMLSRIGDAVKIRTFINSVALGLTVNVMIVVFSFCIMLAMNWRLGMLMCLVMPLYAAIYLISDFLNKKRERKLMEASARLESQLVESLTTIKTIKQFSLEKWANQRTEHRFLNVLGHGYRSAVTQLFSGNGALILNGLFTVVLLWAGSYFVIYRHITPGELMSYYAILGYFTGPVSRLINANKSIQNALIAADRLFEIMDLEREQEDQHSIKSIPANTGIAFRKIDFSYNTCIQLFQGLDLEIPHGKITAIIGESGSGKSSLINLIQRLYQPQGGQILVGGKDIRYLKTSTLRKGIGVVPQGIHLFGGNAVENIAPGQENPDMDKILHLCKELGLLEFIQALPEGFASPLGENGALLSGGQKQRLAIARAFYGDPGILCLDEATSALDSHSESIIRKSLLSRKNQGKTILIIAHRLSSVLFADKIIVLEKGKLIEEGSHQELLGRKSAYYRYWRKQLPGTPRMDLPITP